MQENKAWDRATTHSLLPRESTVSLIRGRVFVVTGTTRCLTLDAADLIRRSCTIIRRYTFSHARFARCLSLNCTLQSSVSENLCFSTQRKLRVHDSSCTATTITACLTCSGGPHGERPSGSGNNTRACNVTVKRIVA